MSGPTRLPSGGAPRQPWAPDQGPPGVTCPACGLANEAGARVCRNCGLPIASAGDPLRGVAPGRVDMPSTHRSGLSATIGLVLVIGLLLVGGSLAVSGGGILSSGGRLVSGAGADPSAVPTSLPEPAEGQVVLDDGEATDSTDPEPDDKPPAEGTSFDYTCEDAAIKDLGKLKWLLSEVAAGPRVDEDGAFDQVYWKMSRQSKQAVKKGTTVRMEWTTPKEAQQDYGIQRVQGDRALIITFDGPVEITANQTIEAEQLEAEGITQVRRIQLFEGEDGKVRAAIGLSSDSCARMEAKGWGGKATPANSRVILDIEVFDGAQ
jgi:hypothetical protein